MDRSISPLPVGIPSDQPGSHLVSGVAHQMRTMIHAGEVRPGDRFPAERELAEHLSVSRVTLREAIRELQDEGYVTVRRGQRGGTYVTGMQGPAQAWRRRMRQDQTAIDEMFDFRIGVEAAAAGFAAQRRTAEDLDRLHDAIEKLQAATTHPEFRRYDSLFHEAVASAARSPRLLRGVRQVRGEVFSPMDLLGIPPSPQDDAKKHLDITAAVRAADSPLASARMISHIEHTRGYLKRILLDSDHSPT